MPKTEPQLTGLASLYEQVGRAVYDERGPKGLQPAQWSALRFFLRAGEKARTVSGLSKYLGVTLGPASRAAAALTKRGLISARPNPDDKRSVLFDLTPAGREQLTKDPLHRLVHALEEIGESERAVFAKTVIHLAETLGAGGGGTRNG